MFVIANENTQVPIKIWLPDEKSIEESCLEQAYHLSRLPFLHQWVSLMPDTHTGMGMRDPASGFGAYDGNADIKICGDFLPRFRLAYRPSVGLS